MEETGIPGVHAFAMIVCSTARMLQRCEILEGDPRGKVMKEDTTMSERYVAVQRVGARPKEVQVIAGEKESHDRQELAEQVRQQLGMEPGELLRQRGIRILTREMAWRTYPVAMRVWYQQGHAVMSTKRGKAGQ